MIRFALTFFFLVSLLPSAEAILWWGKKPIDISPQVQTEMARPIYELALGYEGQGKKRTALKGYKKIFRKYPASVFAAQSLYNYAVIHYENKNWKKSFSAFQSILIYHADYPQFNELIEYQFNIALAHAEKNGVRFLFFIPYRALNRSVNYFELVVNNAPYSALAPLALINIASIHQYKGQIPQAIDALDRLINNYPNSLLADDAYLSLAETFATLVQGPHYDQGATREAISYFEDFLIIFSDNMDLARAEQGLADMEDVYARSKLVIGEYYFKYRRWYGAAEIFFNEAITTAPDSPAADTARDYIVEIEKLRADFAKMLLEGPPPTSKEEESFIRRWMNRIIPGK